MLPWRSHYTFELEKLNSEISLQGHLNKLGLESKWVLQVLHMPSKYVSKVTWGWIFECCSWHLVSTVVDLWRFSHKQTIRLFVLRIIDCVIQTLECGRILHEEFVGSPLTVILRHHSNNVTWGDHWHDCQCSPTLAKVCTQQFHQHLKWHPLDESMQGQRWNK